MLGVAEPAVDVAEHEGVITGELEGERAALTAPGAQQRHSGELHARQNAWLTWLCQAGLDADIWTPRDLRDGTIAAELEALHQPRPGQPPDTEDEARLRALYLPRITTGT